MKTPNQLIEEIVERYNPCRGSNAWDMERVLQDFTSDITDFACQWLSEHFTSKREEMATQGCDTFLLEFRKAMED